MVVTRTDDTMAKCTEMTSIGYQAGKARRRRSPRVEKLSCVSVSILLVELSVYEWLEIASTGSPISSHTNRKTFNTQTDLGVNEDKDLCDVPLLTR